MQRKTLGNKATARSAFEVCVRCNLTGTIAVFTVYADYHAQASRMVVRHGFAVVDSQELKAG